MSGLKRGAGPRSNSYSESKFANWTAFNPFDSEVPALWHRHDLKLLPVATAGSPPIPIFAREVHAQFVRPFSAGDVAEVLDSVPAGFLTGLEAVHLLAGSTKQARAAASPLFHYGCYGHGRIFLHAFPRALLVRQIKSLPKPSVMQEFIRAGAKYTQQDGKYERRMSEASLRHFYLYDVLLHEVGHHFDRRNRRKDRRSSEGFAKWFALEQAKHVRP